jgi:predicted alpha/beta superfamily hydrolase
LAALALGLWFPKVFTRLLVMSPSIWWHDCAIYGMVDQLKEKPPLKIWLDTGTNEPGWERARELRDRLLEVGWRLFDDLEYFEAEGGDHSERAWAARVDPALRFLFPPLPAPVKARTRRSQLFAWARR